MPDDDQVAKENCNHNIKFNGTSISLSFERRALCSLSPRNRISIHLVIDVVNDACRQSQDFQLFHERTNEKKIIEHLKYRNVCCYCCCCASASYVFFTHHQIIRFSIDLLSARDKKNISCAKNMMPRSRSHVYTQQRKQVLFQDAAQSEHVSINFDCYTLGVMFWLLLKAAFKYAALSAMQSLSVR